MFGHLCGRKIRGEVEGSADEMPDLAPHADLVFLSLLASVSSTGPRRLGSSRPRPSTPTVCVDKAELELVQGLEAGRSPKAAPTQALTNTRSRGSKSLCSCACLAKGHPGNTIADHPPPAVASSVFLSLFEQCQPIRPCPSVCCSPSLPNGLLPFSFLPFSLSMIFVTETQEGPTHLGPLVSALCRGASGEQSLGEKHRGARQRMPRFLYDVIAPKLGRSPPNLSSLLLYPPGLLHPHSTAATVPLKLQLLDNWVLTSFPALQ